MNLHIREPEACLQHVSITRVRLAVCLAVCGICLFTSTATAGNLYFRSGIALDNYNDFVFTDTNCLSVTPVALYGCGTGSDNLPYSSKGEVDRSRSVEIGLGLSTLSNMRFEILIEYQPGAVFTGNTNFLDPEQQQSVAAELSTLKNLFVTYLDFPQLSLPGKKKIVPYFGIGFGVTHNRLETTTMTFPVTTTIVPGESETRLMRTASVGVTVALSKHAKLDLGLRYMDQSEVRTGSGEGEVIWRNGARGPLSLDLARTEAELQGYSLRLSFRFSP